MGYKRHGARQLQRRIRAVGLDKALDHRSHLGRALRATRETLTTDLGGADALSQSQLILIERAVRNLAILETIDCHLFKTLERTGRVWYGRGRATTPDPLLKVRGELERGLESTLARLGLERRGREPMSLDAYIRERYGSDDGKGDDEAKGS